MPRVLALALLLVAGCGANQSSVSGQLFMDSEVDLSRFEYLELRAYHDPGDGSPWVEPPDEVPFAATQALAYAEDLEVELVPGQ